MFKVTSKKLTSPTFLIAIIIFLAIIVSTFIFAENNSSPNNFWASFNAWNYVKSFLTQETRAESQLFFFPHFPQRLLYVASEITETSERLVMLNEELLDFIEQCDCQYAESHCKQRMEAGRITACEPGSVSTFGDVCLESVRQAELTSSIESDIHYLIMHLSYLENLMEKEMDSALEKQLQTLREDDAQIIRESLGQFREHGPALADFAKSNLELSSECSAQKCSPSCDLGGSFELKACLLGGTGEQKPMEAKFGAGISLDDLDLGAVSIKKINLSLPEKISLPDLPTLPAFTVFTPDITLTCPTEQQNIFFQTPSPPLPETPILSLSCPNYPSYSSYESSSFLGEGATIFIEAEWYTQIFSYLSENCLEITQRNFTQLDTEEKLEEYQDLMKKCLSPADVVQTILKECDNRWSGLFLAIPDICQKIGTTTGFDWGGRWDLIIDFPWIQINREEAARRNCRNLFNQEGESSPEGCTSAPIITTQGKCDEIRDSDREEAPLSCRLLPLFVGQLEDPPEGFIWGPEISSPSQTIGDYPIPMPGCSLAFPSVPKISFPKIIIPDVRLPAFNFRPFFYVKLPNFIFEDLTLPDIELCDLSECHFMFPHLSFKPPSLKIPEIKTSASIDIPGVPQINIGIAPIRFSPLSFRLPQLINLGSLTTPELDVPSISLPQPKLQMSFRGIKIDFLNLLLGLLSSHIPNLPSGCISLEQEFIPIAITYPDYIFSWPAFPRIPEISFCRDATQYCRNIRGSIREIAAKTSQIENQVNELFRTEIQQKLDSAASQIEQAVQQEIDQQVASISDDIKNALVSHLTRHLADRDPEYAFRLRETPAPMPGIWPIEHDLPCDDIPPLTVAVDNITISPKPLSDFIIDWPKEISINWPDALKELILTQNIGYELPKISLSNLSYSKEINIRLPGLQLSTPSLNFSLLQNATACVSKPPTGGNPCPVSGIEKNLGEIKKENETIKKSSNEIMSVL